MIHLLMAVDPRFHPDVAWWCLVSVVGFLVVAPLAAWRRWPISSAIWTGTLLCAGLWSFVGIHTRCMYPGFHAPGWSWPWTVASGPHLAAFLLFNTAIVTAAWRRPSTEAWIACAAAGLVAVGWRSALDLERTLVATDYFVPGPFDWSSAPALGGVVATVGCLVSLVASRLGHRAVAFLAEAAFSLAIAAVVLAIPLTLLLPQPADFSPSLPVVAELDWHAALGANGSFEAEGPDGVRMEIRDASAPTLDWRRGEGVGGLYLHAEAPLLLRRAGNLLLLTQGREVLTAFRPDAWDFRSEYWEDWTPALALNDRRAAVPWADVALGMSPPWPFTVLAAFGLLVGAALRATRLTDRRTLDAMRLAVLTLCAAPLWVAFVRACLG